MDKKIEISKQIFFFRYDDEKPFAIDKEEHAWDLYAHQSQWTRRGLKYIGQSTGAVYYGMIKKVEIECKELQIQIDKIKKDLASYDTTFQKFKFEDLMDDDDPKMIKLNSITEDLEKKFETAMQEYTKIKKGIVDTAIEAEIVEARKNTTPPANRDFMISKMSDKKVPLEAFNQFRK